MRNKLKSGDFAYNKTINKLCTIIDFFNNTYLVQHLNEGVIEYKTCSINELERIK